MGLRMFRPRLNSSGVFPRRNTQTSMHSMQPTQASSMMKRGLWRTVTLKLPTYPSTLSTSAIVQRVMLGFERTSVIFGVRMQAAQSRVGKVLSNWAMCPPMEGSRSTR